MSAVQSKMNELISAIDNLTQDILEKLEKYEFDDIDLLIENRFDLLKKLLECAEKRPELQNYLRGLLQNDQDIMRRIRKEQEQINHALVNINNLNDYLDSSSH